MPGDVVPALTVAELWRTALADPADRAAYLVEEEGRWVEWRWSDVGRAVDEFAAGFLEQGVAAGDRIAILGRTRLEWVLCDWALISIGALVVPIYPTSSAVECAYILGNSGARVVVCEDDAQVEKVEPARRELEALERIVSFDGLDELRERGRAHLAAWPDAVERARARIGEDDPLTIIYTSGTTGPPKGCVLTHRNWRVMIESVLGIERLVERGDVVLLHLPLAHTFGRLISLLAPAARVTLALCPDAAGIRDALTAVRPTLFPSVPRVYETLAAAVRAGFDQPGGRTQGIRRWALDVGLRVSGAHLAGRRAGPILAVQHLLADRLVLSQVRRRLGGRVRLAISGGAPLQREPAELLHALGVPVLEGYGLTECTTVVTFNRPGAYRLGTVGIPVPGVEVRIAPDGEVLVRGETVFQGYFRDEEATRTVLRADGWLATGDIGVLDTDGYLTITDRKKDLIVTAGGKNVSPQNIEQALRASRYISEALVVGDGRPYLVALLALDHDEIDRVAAGDAEVHELIEEEVARVNRERGRAEHVRAFTILPRDLSEEASELTPTLKVRRRVCEEHFRDEIDCLYGRA